MAQDIKFKQFIGVPQTGERCGEATCLGERNIRVIAIMQQVDLRMNLVDDPAGGEFAQQRFHGGGERCQVCFHPGRGVTGQQVIGSSARRRWLVRWVSSPAWP